MDKFDPLKGHFFMSQNLTFLIASSVSFRPETINAPLCAFADKTLRFVVSPSVRDITTVKEIIDERNWLNFNRKYLQQSKLPCFLKREKEHFLVLFYIRGEEHR